MGYDNRFPWMFRIKDAPGLSPFERKEADRVAKSVCGRCFINCSFNARTGGLFFHYTPEPDSGPFEMTFKPIGEELHRVTDTDIEDVVRIIQYGKASRREKDRWAEREKQAEQDRKQKENQRFKDDVRPDAEDYAAFKSRTRRGVAKVISA